MAIGDVLFDAAEEIRSYLEEGYGEGHQGEIEVLLEVMDAVRLLLDLCPCCAEEMDVEVRCLALALRGIDLSAVRKSLSMWTRRVEALQSAEA